MSTCCENVPQTTCMYRWSKLDKIILMDAALESVLNDKNHATKRS